MSDEPTNTGETSDTPEAEQPAPHPTPPPLASGNAPTRPIPTPDAPFKPVAPVPNRFPLPPAGAVRTGGIISTIPGVSRKGTARLVPAAPFRQPGVPRSPDERPTERLSTPGVPRIPLSPSQAPVPTPVAAVPIVQATPPVPRSTASILEMVSQGDPKAPNVSITQLLERISKSSPGKPAAPPVPRVAAPSSAPAAAPQMALTPPLSVPGPAALEPQLEAEPDSGHDLFAAPPHQDAEAPRQPLKPAILSKPAPGLFPPAAPSARSPLGSQAILLKPTPPGPTQPPSKPAAPASVPTAPGKAPEAAAVFAAVPPAAAQPKADAPVQGAPAAPAAMKKPQPVPKGATGPAAGPATGMVAAPRREVRGSPVAAILAVLLGLGLIGAVVWGNTANSRHKDASNELAMAREAEEKLREDLASLKKNYSVALEQNVAMAGKQTALQDEIAALSKQRDSASEKVVAEAARLKEDLARKEAQLQEFLKGPNFKAEQDAILAMLKAADPALRAYRQGPYIVVRLPDSGFDFQTNTVNDEVRRSLATLSRVFNTYRGGYVLGIEGHSDATALPGGQAFDNLRAGAARSLFIIRELMRLGLSTKNLVLLSQGDSLPVTDPASPANRRVEFVFMPRRILADAKPLAGMEDIPSGAPSAPPAPAPPQSPAPDAPAASPAAATPPPVPGAGLSLSPSADGAPPPPPVPGLNLAPSQ